MRVCVRVCACVPPMRYTKRLGVEQSLSDQRRLFSWPALDHSLVRNRDTDWAWKGPHVHALQAAGPQSNSSNKNLSTLTEYSEF